MTAHAAVPRPAGTGPRRMAVGGVLLTVPAVVLFLLMLLAPLLFALPSAAVHALLAVSAVAGLVGAGFVVAHAVAAGRGGRILAAVAVLALASLHAAAVAAAVLSPSSHLGELGTTVMFGGGLLLAVAGLLCWVDSGGRAELRRRRG